MADTTVINFRESAAAQSALVVAAHRRRTSVSDLIRDAIRKDVPEVAALDAPDATDAPAEVLARVLAGESGSSTALLDLVQKGSDEDRADLLALLVGFVVFEAPKPSLSPDDLRELADCTASRLVPIGPDEPEKLGAVG